MDGEGNAAGPGRAAAGENRCEYTAGLARTEDLDPIAGLISRLDAAVNRCGATSFPCGTEIAVRRVGARFALGPRR